MGRDHEGQGGWGGGLLRGRKETGAQCVRVQEHERTQQHLGGPHWPKVRPISRWLSSCPWCLCPTGHAPDWPIPQKSSMIPGSSTLVRSPEWRMEALLISWDDPDPKEKSPPLTGGGEEGPTSSCFISLTAEGVRERKALGMWVHIPEVTEWRQGTGVRKSIRAEDTF